MDVVTVANLTYLYAHELQCSDVSEIMKTPSLLSCEERFKTCPILSVLVANSSTTMSVCLSFSLSLFSFIRFLPGSSKFSFSFRNELSRGGVRQAFGTPDPFVWEEFGIVPDKIPEVPPALLRLKFPSGVEVSDPNITFTTGLVIMDK